VNATANKIRPAEYARRGLLAIGVPQANPTVEQEVFALRPPGVGIVTTRLVSHAPELADRLHDYLLRTGDYLDAFDDLGFDAYGIACTGSSYLLGAERERALLAELAAARGYPILSAAAAIGDTLRELGAGRIAVVSPYPEWLNGASRAYWTGQGFEVADFRPVARPRDAAHGIYELGSAAALEAARRIDFRAVDAVLFTGTGMPTLAAIQPLAEEAGVAVMSSNLCLMSALCRALGVLQEPLLEPPPAAVCAGL